MSEVKKKKKKNRSQSTNKKCPCIFHVRRLAETIAWPKRLNSHSVERIASASIFWNFWRAFKRCARQTPAKRRRRNVRTQSETKNHCLPPCLEKLMICGKVATLAEEDCASTNTGGLGARFSNTNTPTLWVRYKSSEAAGPLFFTPMFVSQDYVNERSKKVEDRAEEDELTSAAVLLRLCRLIYDSLISAWNCSSYVTISPRSSKNVSRNVTASFPLSRPLIS